jgi:hypothetical protein
MMFQPYHLRQIIDLCLFVLFTMKILHLLTAHMFMIYSEQFFNLIFNYFSWEQEMESTGGSHLRIMQKKWVLI